MSHVEDLRVVPLEAGAGPENPPCPACGEPLFGWIATKLGLAGPVRRCESCGLGVVGEPGGPEEALRELDSLREENGALRIVDRGSFACALGGAGWYGLRRQSKYLFTLEAVRRLVAHRDQVVKSRRWMPATSLVATLQTLL
ncbi:MAG: hypothetical protein M3335_04345, partial [Actinomycetota bacterium]|nr:hypothetical protein [Actinomycetota bacterium]